MYPTSRTEGAVHVDYQPLFLVVSLIMAAAVVVLFLTVREPKLAEENRRLEAAHPEWDLAEDDGSGHETLPAPVKRSLGFLLVSISLWFIAYNGVTTLVHPVRGGGHGGGPGGRLHLPAGGYRRGHRLLHPRGGRGLPVRPEEDHPLRSGPAGRPASCWASSSPPSTAPSSRLCTWSSPWWGWPGPPSTSTPCPWWVEMCRGSDIGKFTGYYYTFSMAAQVVTPIARRRPDQRRGLPGAVPLRRLLRRPGLCHHVLCPPRDVKAAGKRGLDAFGDME